MPGNMLRSSEGGVTNGTLDIKQMVVGGGGAWG